MTAIDDPADLDDTPPRDLTIAELDAIEQARTTPGRNGHVPHRAPPHNLDAEAALIGAALYSPAARNATIDTITPDDFYKPSHGHIWHAITTLHHDGHPIDQITVGDHLDRDGLLDTIGGRSELDTLLANTPDSASAARYATIVTRDAHHRRLLARAHDLEAAVHNHDDAAVANALAGLADQPTGPGRELVRHPLDLTRTPEPPDLICGGWLYAGRLHVINSEPAGGKTWFALGLAALVIETGGDVIYLDEEGGPDLITQRLHALSADPAKVAEHLWYYPWPARTWDDADLAALDQVLAACQRPTLAVLDSLPDFLAAADLDEDRAADVTRFTARVIGRITTAGCAVVALDHLKKPDDSNSRTKRRSRYGRGSGAKLAKADATLLLETETEFDATTSGRLRLWKTKDRLGHLDLPPLNKAGLALDVTVEAGHITISETVDEPVASARDADEWDGPRHCMAAVLELLKATGEEYTGNALIDQMKAASHPFRRDTVREAAERLAIEGQISVRTGARRARLYRWIDGRNTAEDPLDVEF